MLQNLRNTVGRLLVNVPGWKTDRKIIVFESDDWGSARTFSKEKLTELSKQGINTSNSFYLSNDALASEQDLSELFQVLSSYTDSHGNHPVITANSILANPDSERIKASDFKEYHYELFTETLKRYPEHKNSFKLWEEGIKKGVFHPQFHGREHLQVSRWMEYLSNPESHTRKAFDRGIFGLSSNNTSEIIKDYLAAYDWDNEDTRAFVKESISDGLKLFEGLFGFKSMTSIAPNYTWHKDLEPILKEQGVYYIQGSSVQKSPIINQTKFKKERHYTGQRNHMEQIYLVRNGKFEPTSNPTIDWVDICMSNIEAAFYWNKPAIIETHRVNYIGYINPKNRDNNLKQFKKLLTCILNKWPDVEFMASDELGETIKNDQCS